ncbi:DUF1624 domain-containing protein [Acidobacteria bacterium AB60]|nr:DUF1624 domain-containing protein [Acidobacteria bacterium AB60]
MELRPPSTPRRASRLMSLDALRGTVMVIMAIDHIRDFFDRYSMSNSPTDLSQATAIMFLTRWITHFCMPVFMFSAGAGAFLWWNRGQKTRGQLSRFLATRAVWFLALEVVVMNFAYSFNLSAHGLTLLLVLYIFGACMLLMAALIHLPLRWLAVLSIAIIALHNLLDPWSASHFGKFGWAWHLLHQPGVIMLANHPAFVVYPILPWIGVMAAGFCFGQLFTLDDTVRRRTTLRLGLYLTAAFLVSRAVNIYGDPSHWTAQKSAVFTVLSFLNCTKYPASLDYVLMTISTALLLLAWYDGLRFSSRNPLLVFGRVPLFYFILHFYAIHFLLGVVSYIRYGSRTFSFIFNAMPAMGGPRDVYPQDFGYPLWVTYAIWIGLVAALYPLCRWFAQYKATHSSWWLSYL